MPAYRREGLGERSPLARLYEEDPPGAVAAAGAAADDTARGPARKAGDGTDEGFFDDTGQPDQPQKQAS